MVFFSTGFSVFFVSLTAACVVFAGLSSFLSDFFTAFSAVFSALGCLSEAPFCSVFCVLAALSLVVGLDFPFGLSEIFVLSDPVSFFASPAGLFFAES